MIQYLKDFSADFSSDIVAELPVPHSGILTFEEDMPTPNYQWAVEEDGLDPFFMESYNIQLVLRKHLNRLHNMFYKPNLGKSIQNTIANSSNRIR